MSSTNMWSDDSDGSSIASLRGDSGDSSSAQLEGPWSGDPWTYPQTTTLSDSSRQTEMDVDDDVLDDSQEPSTSRQAHFLDDFMSSDDDDDDEELGGGGAHVDILAVTNVLSQGMGLVDDFQPAGSIVPDHPHTGSVGPHAWFPHIPPVGFHPNIAMGTQQAHAPAAPQDGTQAIAANDHHIPVVHHAQIIHPNAMSNPNAHALGPENYNLPDFMRVWAWQNGTLAARERGRYPWPDRINSQMSQNISSVDYTDLEGDRCDVQGIDWEDLGITRSDARERRFNTYKNYVNITNSDLWQTNHDLLPCTEDYFRFRRLDVRKNINLAHFQLRNVLASTSRSHVFYPGQFAVHEFNPITGKGKWGMKSKETPNFQVSTLAADHDVLMAGGFFGEYTFRRLSSEDGGEVHEGTITTDNSGITNHVQVHLSRTSSSPRAAFASNDNYFRVLDVETEQFVSQTYFQKPINCSAISPDGRLRAMVGDQTEVLITKAEADGQPEILNMLDGHGDFGFACDWADDGWTLATGFQDKSVKIWDARRWTDSRGRGLPVCTLRSEVAGVRSLRFSPLGSGKRVLVAAEEADYVNIYDARTFQSKQTFDFFGEIGGTSFVNEGQDLHVLCCDRARGGLFQLERCGMGAERSYDPEDVGHRPYDRRWKNGSYDWQEFETTPRRLPRYSETQRRRRALAVGSLDPF